MRDLGKAFYRKGDEKYLGYNKKFASQLWETNFCSFWVECNIPHRPMQIQYILLRNKKCLTYN